MSLLLLFRNIFLQNLNSLKKTKGATISQFIIEIYIVFKSFIASSCNRQEILSSHWSKNCFCTVQCSFFYFSFMRVLTHCLHWMSILPHVIKVTRQQRAHRCVSDSSTSFWRAPECVHRLQWVDDIDWSTLLSSENFLIHFSSFHGSVFNILT